MNETNSSRLLNYRRSGDVSLPAAAAAGLAERAAKYGVTPSDYVCMLLADDHIPGATHPDGLGPPVEELEAAELRDIVGDLQKADWLLEQLLKRLDPICHWGGDPVAPGVYALLSVARKAVNGASSLHTSNHKEPVRKPPGSHQ